MAQKKMSKHRGPKPAMRKHKRKGAPARAAAVRAQRASFAEIPAALVGEEPLEIFSLEAIAAGCAELERCGLGAWGDGVFEVTDEAGLLERVNANTLPPEAMLAALSLLAGSALAGPPQSLVRLTDGRIVQAFETDAQLEQALGFNPAEMDATRRELLEDGVIVLLHEEGEDELLGMLVEPEELADWEIDPAAIPTQQPGESVRALLLRHGCGHEPAIDPLT